MFRPGLLGLVVNPFYFARRELWRHISDLAPAVRGRTLDVGCGQKPYSSLFQTTEYIGMEIDTPQNRQDKRADVFYDGKSFPFDAERFDSAIIFQVLEHVFNPDEFLAEVHRVLAPGGALLLTIPFVWDEHEQPFDYARYSSFGLRHLLEKHGFEIVEHRKSVDDLRIVFQLINCYLYKKTVTRNAFVNLLLAAVLMLPFNIMGTIWGWIAPRNSDLYLDNIVLARRKAN